MDETNAEFDESLSILSKALCSIPEPFRNKWLDVLVGTAQWLGKDLNTNARLNFSAVVFFNALTELAGYCLEAEEKKADDCYSDKIASFYRIIDVGGRLYIPLFVFGHIIVKPFGKGHFCRIGDNAFLQIIQQVGHFGG